MSIRKFQGNILQLAEKINVPVRSWINYYCKFNKWTTVGIWWYLQRKVVEWVMKTKKIGKYKAIAWLVTVYQNRPNLMAHWQLTRPTLVNRR
ncbi:group II intron maturase-specific domain-containing protein [Ravibacter arvi]|uniref:group II intron maturase-specific domain-containing protein n=1 Tax=Ravibacter arvi TaxID=2051041 RepID=UPI003CD09075